MSGVTLRQRPALPVIELGGGALLALLLAIAALAPWVTPRDPLAQDLAHALAWPSAQHWLGTDDLGRDLASRLMLGARISIEVGFGSAVLALVVGTSAGMIAGFRGGAVEAMVMR